MSAEFNWWLLIVGIVAGGALTWLVLADSSRREREIGERELPAEAEWIARSLQLPGVDAETAERVLVAHRRYLTFPPPDVLVAPEDLETLEEHHEASGDPEEAGDPVATSVDRARTPGGEGFRPGA